MTLTDTGPLVALVDADDAANASCVAAAEALGITRILPSTPISASTVFM